MSKNAPYRHVDGSNCYTKNCSRGNLSATDVRKFELQRALADQRGENFVHADAIAPIEEFYKAAERKEIFRTRHPHLPYSLFKYSPMTQYKKIWNPVTLASRGLVINDETGEIVSRPFQKFFNYSENLTPENLLTGKVQVLDKLDGSLAVSMPLPNGDIRLNTSGGFQAEQGDIATAMFKERYVKNFEMRPNTTYLWEIIYPENRIVVDYGNEKDIFLLGAVDNATGRSIPLNQLDEWKGRRAEQYNEYSSLSDALAAPQSKNKEGFILHFTDTDARVKLKFDEYVHLHRFTTGVNSRRVWENMSTPESFENFRSQIPEEMLDYVDKQHSEINGKYQKMIKSAEDVGRRAQKGVAALTDQKEKALWVKNNFSKNEQSIAFSFLNKGELDDRQKSFFWEKVKPDFEKGFWANQNGKINGTES